MRIFSGLLFLTLAVAGGNAAYTKPSMQDILRSVYGVRDISGVQLSPDGSRVVWVETFRNAQKLSDPVPKTAVFVAPVSSLSQRARLTANGGSGYASEDSPVWSHDGRRIAFLSDARGKHQSQLFIADATARAVHKISNFSGAVSDPKWVGADAAIAVLYVKNAHRKTGATQPGARQTGVIEEAFDEQRLNLVDTHTGAVRAISPASEYVYEYDFSPDGRTAAVTIAPGSGDNNWWIARLATIDVANAQIHTLLKPKFQIAAPRWSPDGKQIAYIGGIMSDFGSTGGDIFLIDPNSGAQRDATPDMPYSAADLQWTDPTRIAFLGHVPGGVKLFMLDTAGGALQQYGSDTGVMAHLSASRDGRYALTESSFDSAPELFVGAAGRLARFTHSNAGAKRLWGKAVSLRWSSDAYKPQGWLVYPLQFDPSRKYAMVVAARWTGGIQSARLGQPQRRRALESELFCILAQSARQLRSG